jgi:phosphatidylinositol alpha-1,6-mannosyltransferase
MQRYAWKVASGLLERRHLLTVFVRRSFSERVDLPGADVQAVLHGCVEEDRVLLRPWAQRLDLWHAMNSGYAWLAASGVPCVVSIYGNDFLSPWIPVSRRGVPLLGSRVNHWLRVQASKRLLRQSFLRVERLLAISNYCKAAFLEKYPECSGKIRVVYGGVDVGEQRVARESQRGTRATRLITVCRLEDRRKNVDLVLRALGRLSRRFEFEYCVVGDGPLRTELELLTHDLGIQERVRFLGRIGDADLLAKLAESDLFVLISSRTPVSFEGFGLVYVEANALGTPVLAARVAGAAEAVQDEVSGYFVKDLSVDAIEAALARFLSGEIQFEAEACRAHAARFPWRATVDAVQDVYCEALEDRSI